ncbi:hypothetical protein LMG28138_02034 [Pararobbsia alpina]|uniref:Fimbrial-type adhesion domain-containing protein n=2 Tax=Pararobbsia alpina TaxID=621374 RepID=A0A6S7B2B0_9BURK|nr:hypothetical protein LMG28138_02034 [Pararobbsia alpina]
MHQKYHINMIKQEPSTWCAESTNWSVQFRRAYRTLLGLLIFSLAPSWSLAGTVTYPANFATIPDLSFDSNITVSPDIAIGTVLQTVEQNLGIRISDITCDWEKNATVNGTPVPGDPKTFQTNVPGIGVRFYITEGWVGRFVQAPISTTISKRGNGAAIDYTRAALVVTGPVSGGTLSTLPSMQITFSGSCITTVSQTQYIKPGSTIAQRTCSVTTPSVIVPLPQIGARSLPNIGSTAGNTAFGIKVECAAGIDLYMTMTDASSPSNRSSNLSLSSDSTAKGAALQILRGQTLISYGPDSALSGTQNQWYVGNATGGVMNIPLSVRYIRTAETLSEGTVKGSATFTMSYE